MLKVLVAPLDWGLGHATRCIPIVQELINQRCTVIIAATGAQKALLMDEFPLLSFVEIPGFRVKYGKNRAFTLIKILFQIPKILIGIKRENQWLRRFAQRESLDLVISDNRFGLHCGGVVSVFMTHQLAIRSSIGGWVDKWLQRMNYNFIRRFSVCWVPDVEGPQSLAGALSHPARMPAVPVRYIGWLSRLAMPGSSPNTSSPNASSPEASPAEASSHNASPAEPSSPNTSPPVAPQGAPIDLLILLSGPEPQRTILESLLLAQLPGGIGRIVLVRGLPGGDTIVKAPAGVQVFDYLGTNDLEQVICRSRRIVTRSGYSTIMDLAKLGKRAIFVPTPGQPEQEYLGRYLEERGLGISLDQRGFVLKEAIRRADLLKRAQEWTGDNALGDEIARVLATAQAAQLARAAQSQSAVADLG